VGWPGRQTARGQQRADLADGAGDGGAVDPEQHRQGLVRQLQAQHDQGGQHPVAQDQPLVGAGAGGAAAWVAAAVGQRGLVLGGPGVGQLGDELAQVLPGDAGEARMGQGRTAPCWRSHPGMIVRPSSCPHDPRDQPASRAPSRSMSRPPESRDDLKASRRCVTTPELGEGRRGTYSAGGGMLPGDER
jgi:hypothetical protein